MTRVEQLKLSAALFSDPAERIRHFGTFYHSKAVFHGYARESSLDFESARKFYSALWSAFPDFQVQVLRELEDDDMVAFHYVWEGTHRGPFAGIPPSNRRVRVEGMSFVRFDGEQVIERWNISDSGSLLAQLGGGRKNGVGDLRVKPDGEANLHGG